MDLAIPNPIHPRHHLYNSWLNAWLTSARLEHQPCTTLGLEQLVDHFRPQSIQSPIDYPTVQLLVYSFRKCLQDGQIRFGGSDPPSCAETNLASASYNPRSECSCTGLFPIPADTTLDNILEKCGCTAIEQTLKAFHTVIQHRAEWDHSSFYTIEGLQRAVEELLLANSNIEKLSLPETCLGPGNIIPAITAPDRRPHPTHDVHPAVRHLIYPKTEQVKLCVDAKQYLVLAANTSISDTGLVAAIADAGNDILIGDYCEVADDETLWLLQQTGAAAVAFVTLSHLAGVLSSWHYNNLMSSTLHFRVMGYYRNHATVPGGIYGSRMTGIITHRYIDLSLFHAVVTSSLATGQEVDEDTYIRLNMACTLLNDLVDLRSDTSRRQRENIVLRGYRGNLCSYLDGLITQCIELVTDCITSGPVGARVVIAFCNWVVLGSHHKVYELIQGTVPHSKAEELCEYYSVSSESLYPRLLDALKPYGTLGKVGPSVRKTRVEMDMMYSACIESERAHLAWLADVTRSLLEPSTFRRIVDVVHFQWRGDVGDVNYCP